MKDLTVTSPNFNLDEPLENMALYDYYEGVTLQKATPQSVFDLFNGVVTAVEEESNARTVLARVHGGYIAFNEIRALELVKSYDTFINAPDFELDVFAVHKFEMENFWHVVYDNTKRGVSNKATTYGKSSIWEISNGKRTVGFILNNMTYDGQNSYCLTSKKLGKHVRRFFKVKAYYPSVKHVNGEPRNRWTRILDELDANDGNMTNAWNILKSEDSRFFYAELKKHMGVDKETRAQIKAIAKKQGKKSFDVIKEDARALVDEMELIMALSEQVDNVESELEEMEDNGASIDELCVIEDVLFLMRHWLSFYGDLTVVELELDETKAWLCSVEEEHNSDKVVSVIEDYDNFNYYSDNYYNEWRFIGNGQ